MEKQKIFAGIKTGVKEFFSSVCSKLDCCICADSLSREKIVYGPINSRRFGNVIGINNVLCKTCTYNCIYCQCGIMNRCSTNRDMCQSPYELYFFVKKKLSEIKAKEYKINYLHFLANGEPTLDINLWKEISLLREFGYKIAVTTNSSLIWNDDVKENLNYADHVSVKIDTVNESSWRKINRPHLRLNLDVILREITEFAKSYRGVLTTDTMLIRDYNDNEEEITAIGNFLNSIKREKSYFTIPVRPVSGNRSLIPQKETLEKLRVVIKDKVANYELLCCPDNDFVIPAGNPEEELLGILTIRPVEERTVDNFLELNGGDKKVFEELITKGLIQKVIYEGKYFYVNAGYNN
jgi:wyosine [tRNA(Phe)-imidazoG37] synthetase (radical SAM superfamily)